MTRIWTSFATCIISFGFRQRTHSRPPAAASRWSDEYISRERVGPTFCHSARGPPLLMSQVVALLQFILIIPATKAMYFGEIVQKLLAHDDTAGTDAHYLMLLGVHKKGTDALDMQAVLTEFIGENCCICWWQLDYYYVGFFAIWKVAKCPDCAWMNIFFHCFVFSIIKISTERIGYTLVLVRMEWNMIHCQ